jgi:hypothetical protein
MGPKAPPVKGLVDKAKAHELNMAVLRRIDPETEEVRGPGQARSGACCRLSDQPLRFTQASGA